MDVLLCSCHCASNCSCKGNGQEVNWHKARKAQESKKNHLAVEWRVRGVSIASLGWGIVLVVVVVVSSL